MTMACVETIPSKNADSEMEEGEIVDELDDLSDICSEEEIVRERIEFLEKFNHVLEKKKARRTSLSSGRHRGHSITQDLSEISATEFEDAFHEPVKTRAEVIVYRNVSNHKNTKSHKQKRKNVNLYKDVSRSNNKKKSKSRKKPLKVISESSDDSDDEYRNKRRKLAYAVFGSAVKKNDKTSLQQRLQKTIHQTQIDVPKTNSNTDPKSAQDIPKLDDTLYLHNSVMNTNENEIEKVQQPEKPLDSPLNIDSIDLCTDDDVVVVENDVVDCAKPQDIVETLLKRELKEVNDSDEDLEILRQCALQSKVAKAKTYKKSVENNCVQLPTKNLPKILSEDVDIDTAELRMICLKSALLKRKVERKQRQKKLLAQSPSELREELLKEQEELMERIASDNNTDIESVDMDIGSDGDDKGKDLTHEDVTKSNIEDFSSINKNVQKSAQMDIAPIEDALEEDEDLLRAKLLTSLSRNLPNLVDPKELNKVDAKEQQPPSVNKVTTPVEKPFVITVGEQQSEDSEVDDETTKNLTKMHHKLSTENQVDFQQKLDMFLKSTRMQVENTTETITPPTKPTPTKKPIQKVIAKDVSNLPKGEQIEYRRLVKRMAELEKMKQLRQSSINMITKQTKDTLKPRNVSFDPEKTKPSNLEQQIATSRKHIAEESVKMLKLKEEGTKLAQRYKIVATELKNLATAITLNKKEQKTVHTKLSKIRLQHQKLLISTSSIHSKTNVSSGIPMVKLQKENNPAKDEHKNLVLKSTKVVDNDLSATAISNSKESVQLDASVNNKNVKMPAKDKKTDINKNLNKYNVADSNNSLPMVANGEVDARSDKPDQSSKMESRECDDYQSPLQVFGKASWDGDPHAILCPFEVGGDCKDSDCKYLHPKLPIQQ